jgi:hypothetical protein
MLHCMTISQARTIVGQPPDVDVKKPPKQENPILPEGCSRQWMGNLGIGAYDLEKAGPNQ